MKPNTDFSFPPDPPRTNLDEKGQSPRFEKDAKGNIAGWHDGWNNQSELLFRGKPTGTRLSHVYPAFVFETERGYLLLTLQQNYEDMWLSILYLGQDFRILDGGQVWTTSWPFPGTYFCRILSLDESDLLALTVIDNQTLELDFGKYGLLKVVVHEEPRKFIQSYAASFEYRPWSFFRPRYLKVSLHRHRSVRVLRFLKLFGFGK